MLTQGQEEGHRAPAEPHSRLSVSSQPSDTKSPQPRESSQNTPPSPEACSPPSDGTLNRWYLGSMLESRGGPSRGPALDLELRGRLLSLALRLKSISCSLSPPNIPLVASLSPHCSTVYISSGQFFLHQAFLNASVRM